MRRIDRSLGTKNAGNHGEGCRAISPPSTRAQVSLRPETETGVKNPGRTCLGAEHHGWNLASHTSQLALELCTTGSSHNSSSVLCRQCQERLTPVRLTISVVRSRLGDLPSDAAAPDSVPCSKSSNAASNQQVGTTWSVACGRRHPPTSPATCGVRDTVTNVPITAPFLHASRCSTDRPEPYLFLCSTAACVAQGEFLPNPNASTQAARK